MAIPDATKLRKTPEIANAKASRSRAMDATATGVMNSEELEAGLKDSIKKGESKVSVSVPVKGDLVRDFDDAWRFEVKDPQTGQATRVETTQVSDEVANRLRQLHYDNVRVEPTQGVFLNDMELAIAFSVPE